MNCIKGRTMWLNLEIKKRKYFQILGHFLDRLINYQTRLLFFIPIYFQKVLIWFWNLSNGYFIPTIFQIFFYNTPGNTKNMRNMLMLFVLITLCWTKADFDLFIIVSYAEKLRHVQANKIKIVWLGCSKLDNIHFLNKDC